jgi:hypothetical protein
MCMRVRTLACTCGSGRVVNMTSCVVRARHERRYGKALGFTNQSGKITVPGAWEAQGYGNQTVQMHTQVLTGDTVKGKTGAVGRYSRTVTLPQCSVAGSRVMLIVGRLAVALTCFLLEFIRRSLL